MERRKSVRWTPWAPLSCRGRSEGEWGRRFFQWGKAEVGAGCNEPHQLKPTATGKASGRWAQREHGLTAAVSMPASPFAGLRITNLAQRFMDSGKIFCQRKLATLCRKVALLRRQEPVWEHCRQESSELNGILCLYSLVGGWQHQIPISKWWGGIICAGIRRSSRPQRWFVRQGVFKQRMISGVCTCTTVVKEIRATQSKENKTVLKITAVSLTPKQKAWPVGLQNSLSRVLGCA